MNETNTFNPEDWQASEEKSATSKPAANEQQTTTPATIADDIETITQRIEAAQVDITQGYQNWLDIGFALTDAIGEDGRDIFHRISRFHPNYNEADADKQYDKCIRSDGFGVTIKSFFGKAQEAGINIYTDSFPPKSPESPKTPYGENGDIGDLEDLEQVSLPTFYDEVKDKLPPFIRKIAEVGDSPQESDAMTLGAITVISSCLPNIYGEYDSTTVYPNLFFFLTARASSGKGRLNFCRQIVLPIHRELRELHELELAQYKADLAVWDGKKKSERGQKPEKPIRSRIFLPANNSSTGMYEVLKKNNEKGLMFETEGDTLANTFETDYGDFSDGFRKAFHHEPISYHRRLDEEDVEIDTPRLSVVLTGTPKQVTSLIKNTENGLFSRFMFYRLTSSLVWKDVFSDNGTQSLNMRFQDIGSEFHSFYQTLKSCGLTRFYLTSQQRNTFHNYFSSLQNEYYDLFKEDILASVRRLGLICFRIAMILTTIRYVNSDEMPNELICDDDDFVVAMDISKVLAVHMAKIFEELSSYEKSKIAEVVNTSKRQRFLDGLSQEFDRQDYLAVAKGIGVPEGTAEKWIRAFCCESGPLERVEHGRYRKK